MNERQLNKANLFDTEAPFFDLDLSITNDIVSSKIYDKRTNFNFETQKTLYTDTLYNTKFLSSVNSICKILPA